MKKLLLGLTLLASMSSFGDELLECAKDVRGAQYSSEEIISLADAVELCKG